MVKLGPNTPTRANWPSQNAQFMLTWWKTETRSGEQRFEQFGSTAAINWGSRSLKIILLNICTCGPRNFALLRFEPQASKYCYFTLYSPKKKYFLSSPFVCKFYFSTNLWSHILFVHKSIFYLSTNLCVHIFICPQIYFIWIHIYTIHFSMLEYYYFCSLTHTIHNSFI